MTTAHARSESRTEAFALVTMAYLLAVCAGVLVGYALSSRHPIVTALGADVSATLVIYLFSRLFRNASFYDPYWSVAPLFIALYWMLGPASHDAVAARQIVVVTLVFAWGLRLTYNWASGWRGLKHEDWRYAGYRERTGRLFWLVDLFGIELMPTLVVFCGCLSLYPALAAGGRSLGALDGLAIVITAGAIIIETTADLQLRRFAAEKKEPGEIMSRGLWAWSRHPNYLGEVAFWWGLYFFGLAADRGYWWTIAGPLAITGLFWFISIPMMDKRSMERRPAYAEHMKKVPAFLPWFPKNNA